MLPRLLGPGLALVVLAHGSMATAMDDPAQCLALAMYHEARGDGREGMEAVGWVVLNRVANPDFPDSVCDVVTEGGPTPPCQFSWWCDDLSNEPKEPDSWRLALDVAKELLRRPRRDPTRQALFFHSISIAAPWRRPKTAQIGDHIFYR